MIYKLKRFIDRKKITSIDYAFIVLGIFVIGFTLFFFMRKKAVVFIDLTYQSPEYLQTPFPPEFWKVNSINVGDIAYSSTGRQVAKIIQVEKSDWGSNRVSILLTLEAETIYNTRTKTHSLDGNPLVIGNDLNLNLGITNFKGSIINVYSSTQERFSNFDLATAEVKVKYRNLEPWHANSLVNFSVTDSTGKTILSTKHTQVTYAQKAVVTDRGNIVESYDQTKRDVLATFILNKVLCADNTCYFNYTQPLKIGQEFWAHSPTTFIGNVGYDPQRGYGSIVEVKITYKQKK